MDEKKGFDCMLPETGFLRLPQIIGDSRSDPPIPALIRAVRCSLPEDPSGRQLQ